MPIYVYECQSCKHVEEVIQKMTDPPLTSCEECGGEVKKLLTVANAHFKGVGWASEGYSRASMGKVGPLVADVQHDMNEAGAKAAEHDGHVAGRRAVNKQLDKMEGKPGE